MTRRTDAEVEAYREGFEAGRRQGEAGAVAMAGKAYAEWPPGELSNARFQDHARRVIAERAAKESR